MVRAARLTILGIILITAFFVVAQTTYAGRCFFYSEDVGTVCDGRLEPDQNQFEEPNPRNDDLAEDTVYAYLRDDVFVYPEPDLGAYPLYNLGEGFLYVTVHGEETVNGRRWVAINPGQYALEEDIEVVETPEFQGIEILLQPERPFGWIVESVRPSDEPEGEPNPVHNELDRYSFIQVYDAVLGEQGWIWYQIGGGRWIRQTYASIVDVDAPPDEVGKGEFWVEVDLYEQTMAAYEGARMVYASLVSSGLNRWPSEEGLFQVWLRYEYQRMSGAEGEVDFYFLEDVPHVMYFDQKNEIALHGAYWHDRFGYKRSHGCINMPPKDAEWIYYWSAGALNDLWVNVHTSNPHNYFEKFETNVLESS
jgi:hypothetical protein